MKQIPLTKGKYAIVDDEDFVFLNRLKWTACIKKDRIYAVITKKVEQSRKNARFYMHELLIDSTSYDTVGFKNQNSLDNRKENLLFYPVGFKMHRGKKYNRPGLKHSKYKGVFFHKTSGRWQARIQKDKKDHYLGYFKKEEDAGLAYNKKAKELYGEFAYQNNIK